MKSEQAVRPLWVAALVVLAASLGYSTGLNQGQLLASTEAAWIAATAAREEASLWPRQVEVPCEDP